MDVGGLVRAHQAGSRPREARSSLQRGDRSGAHHPRTRGSRTLRDEVLEEERRFVERLSEGTERRPEPSLPCPAPAKRLDPPVDDLALSRLRDERREPARQEEVVKALRRGKANKIIAHELNLRESTVKVHIRNIMKKLRATNRTEVAYKLNEMFPFTSGAPN